MKTIESQVWVVKDGSIFVASTEQKYNPDFKVKYETQAAVAFNVGDKLAKHIVELHNTSLKKL